MNLDGSEDPFFLSFTDVLTCVLGASVALFLIFVVTVKLAPAQDARSAGIGPRSGLAYAIEKEKSGGKTPAVLQLVSACSFVTGITGEGTVTPELWEFETVGKNLTRRCGKLFLFPAGLPTAPFAVKAQNLTDQPIIVSLTVGAKTWPETVTISPELFFARDRIILTLDTNTRQLIRFSTEDSRPPHSRSR